MMILLHLTYFPSLSTALCAAGDHFVPVEREKTGQELIHAIQNARFMGSSSVVEPHRYHLAHS